MNKQTTPTAKERQAALDNISAEDLAKIQQVQGKTIRVEPEDLLLAEFARVYGWQAYKDVKADKVTSNEMARLLAASRKLYMKDLFIQAQASFIGASAARAKRPSQAFKSMTSKLQKLTEADK